MLQICKFKIKTHRIFCEFFIFALMKRIYLFLGILSTNVFFAQFNINISSNQANVNNKKVIIYKLNGSKEFIISQAERKKDKWVINVSENYKGVLRAYFPESNQSINFISENKNIDIELDIENNKIVDVNYIDEANRAWEEVNDLKQKRENILPALIQIKELYNDGKAFDNALKNEIKRLESVDIEQQEGTFIKFYIDNVKYTSRQENLSIDEYKKFLLQSGEILESSSLMRSVLINLLRVIPRENLTKEIDALLGELNTKTPRGQTVLSEFLSIFETYGFDSEKKRYYEMASALTCTINENLASNLKMIKNTQIGATFEDYTFTPMVRNTKAKKLSDVKANNKVVLFWSSTCPHCLSELPIILENYKKLKDKDIEVVAISVDSDKSSYEAQVNALPWINDTELRGWKSSFVEKYNVHATPTYFILDGNNKIIDKPANFSAFLSTLN